MLKNIKAKLAKYDWANFGLVILSGFVLSLPFLRIQLGWLGFVTLLPFLYLLLRFENKKLKPRKIIKYTWLMGMVFMAITISWMFQLNTIGLLQDPITKIIFLPLTLGLMVLFFSSGFALFGWLYTKLKVSLNNKSSFLLVPAIWMLGEFVRSVVFSICSLGEGGTVGMHWNFGALGLGVATTPMIFASRIVGLFGLSFLVVLINLAVFQLIRRKFMLYALAIIGACTLVASIGYYGYHNSSTNSSQKVGVVHLGPLEDIDYENSLKNQAENVSDKVSLVIFPEYSHLFEEERLKDADQAIVNMLIEGPESRILTTRSIAKDGKETNAIVELTPDNKELSSQGKTFLIPGGEYIPYIYKALLVASANYDLIRHHEGQNTVYQSKTPIKPIHIKGVKYGVLACSGIIAPEFYRGLVNDGATILVNSASLSTMGMGKEFFDQAYQMARFQAVANSRPLIQSARGEKSYIMNNNGQIIIQNSTQDTTYLVGYVKPNSTKTIYSRFGEWVVYLSAIGLVIYGFTMANIKKKFV